MPQANFAYNLPANDPAGVPLALSMFADRCHLREQLREDAEAAGFRIAEVAEVAALLAGSDDGAEARPLGEVVLLDCPVVDGARLAALARLDLRAANSGAHLVVSTTVEALDDVFACLDQSAPQILVDPTRAERVIALGRVLAKIPNLRVRELTEEDRLMLLRLTEQVGQIAQRLERLEGPARRPGQAEDDSVFRFESPRPGFAGAVSDGNERLVRAARPPLPEPRLVRQIIRQRQLRARFFEGDLFADPAWDMLLDLTAARAEHTRVSVTSLCIASGVPPTTALRWIGQMTEAGLLMRVEDETDRRRAFITLTDKAIDAMARYFAELGPRAAALV
ncbi:winged helix DNA-binding protein [Novosphingobium sp.]|uniref:winged helix DNA-binding protein n=1 Tax=Novosphingobium sp. TaxID=1874826 RepID=UPI0022CB6CD1|nr:winged helix DNA-binding protein [Novosphingobium sp.]MCZ8018126.1 winged helix DNA-binding protein [Novosphingobium sp.]MCZ8034445.1 winged helix DNA-binding protein [Novosphingobium sp.]MCZ8052413.1 winged helix DNA-binding protein [Novosphingobium sp.]MCZ8061278.1 winged helix DNA-binding protein [Novosphingobium sp.]MCZ8232909.1 winged helix DNA-binding protein [Novosphingobium sp.]